MSQMPWMPRVLAALAGVLVAPLALPAALGIRFGSAGAFSAGGHLLGLIPGRCGQYLRAGFYVSTLQSCAGEVVLNFMTTISSPHAMVGANVVTGCYVTLGYVDVGQGATIGDRAIVGREYSGDMDSGPELVQVGAGCVIGEGAVILADVGAGAYIEPGTVVMKAVPKGATGSGHPLCIT